MFRADVRSPVGSHAGEDWGLRAFVTDKWPEMLVALGFLMTWTAIAFSDF